MNNNILIKAAGVIMVSLLLILFLSIASPLNSNHRAAYRCGSCGTSSSYNYQASSSGLEKLEGSEKEEVLSKAMQSKDFKTVVSILAKAGYEPTLDGAIAATATKIVHERPIEYLAVGIYFTGDLEYRPVVVLVYLKPYQEAWAFRLDEKRGVLELLVKVREGQARAGKLSSSGFGDLAIFDESWSAIGVLPLVEDCPHCYIKVRHCTEWSFPECLSFCCGPCAYECARLKLADCLFCVGIFCPVCMNICCLIWGYWDCEPCQPEGCWTLPECYDCPVCGP
ncbi:MAG: hypothetical protein QXI42_10995 [Thermoproteota archaeon]